MDPRTAELASAMMDKVNQRFVLERSNDCYKLASEYRAKGMLDAHRRFLDQAVAWRALYLRMNELGVMA